MTEKRNAWDLIHPDLPLDELRPTRGSRAAAVSGLMQMVAIICSCLRDEDELGELEIHHGEDEEETVWWSGITRRGKLLAWGIVQMGDEWASELTIDWAMEDDDRLVRFQLRNINGEHEVIMIYRRNTVLTEREMREIEELIDAIGYTRDSHMESDPTRPQFSSRSPGTIRACAIVADAVNWFLDNGNDD